MLNKDLFLNEAVFSAEVEQKATRDGFGTGIMELGEKDENVVVLTADLSESTRCDAFEKKFTERFFDTGVAEQNMALIASGLAVSGKIAFISSYATFNPGRNWEPIRTAIVYNKANVKIAGHHSGVMTGPDGATHQATEDIASVRAWPGMEVVVPCDALEAHKATVYVGGHNNPAYLRFSRDKTPIITTNKTPFAPHKIQTFWLSSNPEVTIFATGYMLYQAMLAAYELEQEGIEVLVANVAIIKPLDIKSVVELAGQTGAVVTVEDHQIAGGLGSVIAETLAQNLPTPQEFIGLRDTFAESGSPQELLEKYKMDHKAIKDAVKKVLSRK